MAVVKVFPVISADLLPLLLWAALLLFQAGPTTAPHELGDVDRARDVATWA